MRKDKDRPRRGAHAPRRRGPQEKPASPELSARPPRPVIADKVYTRIWP